MSFHCNFSKHWPSGPMLSISWFVRVSFRVCVRLLTFELSFKRLFASTSQSRMSKIFRDAASLGKSNGKKWSQNWSKIAAQKKNSFFLLILPYKTCWNPHFPMDERPLVRGYITNFGISLDVFEFLRFKWFFPF